MNDEFEPFRFGRNVGILAIGEVLSRGLTFLAFTRLARLLSLPGYGLLELAQASMIFLTTVVDLGTGKTAAREIAANGAVVPAGLIRTVVSIQFLLSVAVIIVLATPGIRLPLDHGLRRLLLGFAASLVGYPFLFGWLFQGRSQMAAVAVMQVVRCGIFLAITLVVVNSSADLYRIPWAEIGAVAAAAAGYVILIRNTDETAFLTPPDPRHLLQLVEVSLPVFGSQFVWACRMYLPMLLMARYCDRSSIGYFGAALRILMVGQTLLSTYFTTLFPALSALSRDPSGALANLLQKSVTRLVGLLALVAAGVSVSAPLVMRIVFGRKFVDPRATTSLLLLVWTLPILAWRRHYSDALVALRRSGEEFLCSLFGLGLLVFVNISLAHIGVFAGALAMLGAELATAILAAWRLRRHVASLPLTGSGKSRVPA